MSGAIRIGAVGDILITGRVLDRLHTHGPEDPFGAVRDHLVGVDLLLGNLEGPLAVPREDSPVAVHSHPAAATSLRAGGFSVVSRANNHIFDLGLHGFHQTVRALDEAGIAHLGAGEDAAGATAPLIREVDGLRVGIVAASWEFIGSPPVGRLAPGTVPLEGDALVRRIGDLRASCDVVVAVVHWGYVDEHHPLPSHRALAHRLVDAGATLVIGHHPHVLQGIERRGEALIAYSLGNFVFPEIVLGGRTITPASHNREGLVLSCEVGRTGVGAVELIPVIADDDYRPAPAPGPRAETIRRRVDDLSRGFDLDAAAYRRYWRRHRTRHDLPDLGGDGAVTAMLRSWKRHRTGRRLLRLLARL